MHQPFFPVLPLCGHGATTTCTAAPRSLPSPPPPPPLPLSAVQEPFELTRTATKSKSNLQLIVNGQDLTQQEQRLTEKELEERFSASLLPRTLVFTQEDLLELLQVCAWDFVRSCCHVDGQ